MSDWRVGLNYVMPWLRPTVGVALRDGVGEMDATAAFEVYSQSFAARAVPIAAGDTVHTRHGLVLLTTDIGDAPALSWMVAPGAATPDAIDPRLRAWAASKGLTIEPLGRRLGGGFTAALQNLAVHTDPATTTATAKMLGRDFVGNVAGSRWASCEASLTAFASIWICGEPAKHCLI